MLFLILCLFFISSVLSSNSGWGMLIAAFGPIAFLASGGIGGPYHLSPSLMFTICLFLWGLMCVAMWLLFDRDGDSTLFGASARFWGLGLIVAGIAMTYYGWPEIQSHIKGA
jgi:hypothetical protein